MPKFLKPFILVIATVALAGGVLGVGKAEARSTSECSKALIHDWYVDGRVDKTYPVHCYREALRDIPEDQLIYGTLRDDLTRALQSVIRKHNGKVGPNTPVPGADDQNGGGPLPPGGGGGKGGGFFHWLAGKLGPSTADTIPIPLLVLGGLALMLMLAAAVSFFARRVQARRAATDPPRPGPTF